MTNKLIKRVLTSQNLLTYQKTNAIVLKSDIQEFTHKLQLMKFFSL